MQPSQSFITKAQNHRAGRADREIWAGSASDEVWKREMPLTRHAELMWSGLGAREWTEWPSQLSAQPGGSTKRDIWFILGLYPSDSEIFLDSCQESQWWVKQRFKSQDSQFPAIPFSPLLCFPLCLFADFPSLINCKTPESRGSFPFCPLLPSYAGLP